ncbi:MAG: hypothetical protein TREMPRED_002120 [Tremellales sp. Tagirdzhanova-0007]|nr:MAG: hypothetical protein TREMPRED_002120 [Tremellales sp. Tagirdzhanova-0007]
MASVISNRRPVLAIAGLACETSTFTPSRTLAPQFHPKRDDEITQYYPFLRPSTPLGEAADWKGALIGHALPGGIVTRDAYEELSAEIVERLSTTIAKHGPIDGLWFDIHGAMVVEGMDDAETDLLGRIRAVIGQKPIVCASMDLHGNVSRELAHQTDIITCYRLAPHEDALETKERAVRNLVDAVRLANPPTVKAWLPLPILLPGEQTSTRLEPAKGIYGAVSQVEAREGVLDAAIWVGYAWADEPRNRAVIMVIGWDEVACRTGAEDLGRMFWDAHKDFKFVAPTGTYAECLDAAVQSGQEDRPYFISDSGDNPTAGGSGDVTWGLTELLARPEFKNPTGPTVLYASVPGTEAIATVIKAGIGATVTVTAGATVDYAHAGPVTLTGRVHAIKQGDSNAKTEVVIQVGSVFAIITELRKPYHKEHDFTDLNLKPREADIVIVKIGYLEPELYDMAKGWMLALTPGGVDQALERLGHRRIRRPMWPFDKTFEIEVNLKAEMIPVSREPLLDSDR